MYNAYAAKNKKEYPENKLGYIVNNSHIVEDASDNVKFNAIYQSLKLSDHQLVHFCNYK